MTPRRAPAVVRKSTPHERTWAVLAHVGPIVVGFWAPLIIWLALRRRSDFAAEHSREALNFQLLVTIAYAVGALLTVIYVGFGVLAATWLLTVILGIRCAVGASRGRWTDYPLNWHVVK